MGQLLNGVVLPVRLAELTVPSERASGVWSVVITGFFFLKYQGVFHSASYCNLLKTRILFSPNKWGEINVLAEL